MSVCPQGHAEPHDGEEQPHYGTGHAVYEQAVETVEERDPDAGESHGYDAEHVHGER